MARKFLYLIAGAVALILAAGIIWQLFNERLIRFALVPSTPYTKQTPAPANAYADKAMWIARPDISGNPAQWTPTGYPRPASIGNAAIFFVHPTSYLDRSAWNAPLTDKTANDRAALFVRFEASPFNSVGDIWSPRYRQATFGAFLTPKADAKQAIDLAYGDVLAAFDQFTATIAPNRPIILAGHSQGSLHVLRLLRDRVTRKPLARQIVAAYAAGWPVSVETDIPALGLSACKNADQTGCILSWLSYAEPADPADFLAVHDSSIGFDGRPRNGTNIMCSNPLTGTLNGAANASQNQGTLIPSLDLKSAALVKNRVPARCGDRGILLIGSPPKGVGTYVLPGNNYHVFDYPLFWANVRNDADRRLKAFNAQ